MGNRPVPIDQALHRRMRLIAQAMAERVSPGPWAGYRADELLVTRYERPSSLGGAPTVSAHRANNREASISIGFLQMVDIQEERVSDRQVTRDGIQERHRFDVGFKHAIHYREELVHEFERTVSFSQAAKQAWEVAAKASLSVEYAGIKGAVEVSGKYGQELEQRASQSTTERDRVTKLLEFTGPAEFKLEAFRSRNRERRVVTARADFDGKIYFRTDGQWEFTTFRTQFLPVARRTASDDIYGYEQFRAKPLSDAELDALEAPADSLIEFPVEYDEVLTQTLREV